MPGWPIKDGHISGNGRYVNLCRDGFKSQQWLGHRISTMKQRLLTAKELALIRNAVRTIKFFEYLNYGQAMALNII